VEESDRDLLQGTIQAFAWRDRKELRKIVMSIIRVPAEIRTGHIPNTSEKIYRLRQLARWERVWVK
jgi:hypothetical protein